jgi:hypothetical protein
MELTAITTELAAVIVAGYAAVVATISLGWQIYSKRRTRRPDVEVTLTNAERALPRAV